MPEESADKLIQLLEETRPAVQAALGEAEQELEELRARQRELEALIARARVALGELDPPGPEAITANPRRAELAATTAAPADPPQERLTLHAAMKLVLEENQNRWMTVHELANEINSRALYEKRDRTMIDPSQIHARANKYPALFAKDGPRVRLK